MTSSADLVRDLALLLEGLERSPPEPLILDLGDLAGRLRATPEATEMSFERLSELDLIEGPGPHMGAWIFRRLSPRGRVFVDEIRSAGRWKAIKAQFGEA